jgi:MFS family permease
LTERQAVLPRTLTLLVLSLASAAAVYQRTAVSPLQEAMRTALNLTDNQMALLQGPALALPMMIAAVPLGFLIDRHSRVRVLLVLALLSLAGSVLTAFASGIVLLFALRCIVGLPSPATGMTVVSVIADLYPPAQRGRANIVMAMFQVGGMSAAFAVGGALLQHFESDPQGWRPSLLWMSCLMAVIAPLLLVVSDPRQHAVVSIRRPIRESSRELWKYRTVLMPLIAGQVMVGIADQSVIIWAAPTLTRHFSVPPGQVGVIMATVLLVSGILGPLVGGFLADMGQRSGGPRRTLGVMCAIAVVCIPAGLFPLTPTVAAAAVLLTLLTTIGYAISVATGTVLTIVIPAELRGACLGLSVTANQIFCFGLAPLVVSLLAGIMGGAAMIGHALGVVCVVISATGAVLFAVGRRVVGAAA